MRILILSDIHANLEALEACLAAAPPHDRVFNLGDIVGYGANPNEVTERSRELGTVFVRGNHDKACSGVTSLDDFNPIAGLAVLWTRQKLKPENLSFLHDLPSGPISPFEGLQCVHGSPRDEDEYVLMRRDAYSILGRASAPVTFFGHTHVQGGFWIDDETDDEGGLELKYNSRTGLQQLTVELRETSKYMINPGSIGQPRDGDPRAAFLVYDTEQRSVTFFRVPYDIAAAQEKIFAAGLPERLAIRLEEGH
ncbi:MAG TPA: metallophosphoesterase family protein [Candidatus Angelobacter sp.]|nr:metallophosphoesterase family protein [Candidatus Angelobacter sp.]